MRTYKGREKERGRVIRGREWGKVTMGEGEGGKERGRKDVEVD